MASTAEILRGKLGVESPFAEETPEEIKEIDDTEEVNEPEDKESEDEAEETPDDGESEEESEDEPEEDESEIDSEKISKENDNLKIALKEERGLRQAAKSEIDNLRTAAQTANEIAEDLQSQIDSVIEQLKENDIEDLISIKPKVDPKVRELLAEKARNEAEQKANKARAEFDSGMVSEAKATISDFNNIDLTNQEHGIALQSMIYANHLVSGMDMKDAVKTAMETLDKMLITTLKKRTPPVKPKKKVKAVSKTASSSAKDLPPIERIRLARERAEN